MGSEFGPDRSKVDSVAAASQGEFWLSYPFSCCPRLFARNKKSTRVMGASSTSHRFLTKTLFARACECPRKLAYALSPNYSQQKPSNLLQNLAENGMKVGVYSRLLFPDGVEIGKLSGSKAMDELVKETNELLNTNETVTLFEAAIQSGPYFVRTDILHKISDNHLKLMEVKAKAWDSRKGKDELMTTKKGGIKSDFLPYLQDVAFQKLVAQLAFPDMTVAASLVLPDKALINTKIPNLNTMFQTVYDKNGRAQIMLDEHSRQQILEAEEMLVTEVDVDEIVDQVLDSELKYPGYRRGQVFRDVVSEWGNKLLEKVDDFENCFLPSIGSQCGACEFRCTQNDGEASGSSGFGQCWKEAAGIEPATQNELVVDLYFGGKTTQKLIAAEKFRFSDVEPEDLGLSEDGVDHKKKSTSGLSRSEKQWYQVTNIQSPVLDIKYLEQEMYSWDYPYHFIDFETISPVLPYTTNKSPYDALAFQFSHHTMDRDGSVEHVGEFLFARPGECPNRPFLEALTESLAHSEGTVFRWGAHENTILAALLRSESSGAFPVIESLLTGGDRAMVDLMQILAKGYYAVGSGASSSLKKLLLPTMQASKELQMIYSEPTYSGKNFTDMQWWVASEEDGLPCDPYSLLGTFETDVSGIAQGGDAIAAYETLQRVDLDPEVRAATEASLLRYCELDTLAMAMVLQGVEDLSG